MLVNVTVLDANDNAPEFSQSGYSTSIPWNASMDYVVATVHAVDPDLGENARIAYSIAKVSNSSFFLLNSVNFSCDNFSK